MDEILVPVVMARNDPRLMIAIKVWATKNIQKRVNEELDKLNETMVIHPGDEINLTYRLNVGAEVIDMLAQSHGIKLP